MNLYPIINSNSLKTRSSINFLLLGKLEKAVFEKRRVLGEAYLKDGNLSLFEFTKNQFSVPAETVVSETKKREVIQVIKEETEKRLNAEVANRIEKQLERDYMAITADHHGPLTDPRFLNSNLLAYNVSQYKNQVNDILVLSCANVSFDNPSFPRGLEFHIVKDGVVSLNQLVFFPRKVRPLIVSGYPSYQLENITTLKERIEAFVREGDINKTVGEKLKSIVEEIYADPSLYGLKTFSEQITKTNFALWKKLVGNTETSSNLIYLEQEQIVNALILKHHLTGNSIINRILFDTTIYDTFIKHLNGVNRAFSLENKSGTYLFWAVPKDQKYRLQLWKEGNQLVSSDGSYKIDLTPEAIGKAIQDGELIPSTLLDFIVLGFYYGLSLVGGVRQTTYLTEMKQAYMNFVKAIGDTADSLFVDKIPTDKLSAMFPGIAFLSDKNKDLIPATTLDLLLYGDEKYMNTINYMSQKISLQQAIARILPYVYEEEVPDNERNEKLKNITIKDIDTLTNFATTIVPCGYIG